MFNLLGIFKAFGSYFLTSYKAIIIAFEQLRLSESRMEIITKVYFLLKIIVFI